MISIPHFRSVIAGVTSLPWLPLAELIYTWKIPDLVKIIIYLII